MSDFGEVTERVGCECASIRRVSKETRAARSPQIFEFTK